MQRFNEWNFTKIIIGIYLLIVVGFSCATMQTVGKAAAACSKDWIKSSICGRYQGYIKAACEDIVDQGGKAMWNRLENELNIFEGEECK